MAKVDIAEMFVSIQGESTFAGLGCFFIRLAGCNLRCLYCDTPEALEAGQQEVEVASVVQCACDSRVPLVEITGGEPLLQSGLSELARALVSLPGKQVLIETNGSQDISRIPEGAIAIVDVKCPGSGAGESFDFENLERLRADDELKFVLMSREDYEWAREFVIGHRLSKQGNPIHFSPVQGALDATLLGQWILEDGLQVRLQVQLHRILGVK